MEIQYFTYQEMERKHSKRVTLKENFYHIDKGSIGTVDWGSFVPLDRSKHIVHVQFDVSDKDMWSSYESWLAYHNLRSRRRISFNKTEYKKFLKEINKKG